MGVSLEGPLDERVRTDVRISRRVLRILQEQGVKLGIPKNALFTMGVCFLAASLMPLLVGKKKRERMLDEIEVLFGQVIAEAREAS